MAVLDILAKEGRGESVVEIPLGAAPDAVVPNGPTLLSAIDTILNTKLPEIKNMVLAGL